MSERPSIPSVIEAFRAYREHPGNGAWGSLHLVLDDGNVKNSAVAFCIEYAAREGDTEGERLARILLQMSPTQRRKIGATA